jgi:hypothetical protein
MLHSRNASQGDDRDTSLLYDESKKHDAGGSVVGFHRGTQIPPSSIQYLQDHRASDSDVSKVKGPAQERYNLGVRALEQDAASSYAPHSMLQYENYDQREKGIEEERLNIAATATNTLVDSEIIKGIEQSVDFLLHDRNGGHRGGSSSCKCKKNLYELLQRDSHDHQASLSTLSARIMGGVF